MDDETYQLLYADEHGEIVGVDEVQLLDSADDRQARTPRLRQLLVDGSPSEQYAALLILLAWGDEVAVERASFVLEEPGSRMEGTDPHRLYGVDLTIDKIADALGVGIGCNGLSTEEAKPLALRILDLSANVFVRNGLGGLIAAIGDVAMAPKTEATVRALAAEGRHREASALLDGLAGLDHDATWTLIDEFLANNESDIFATDIIRALARIGSDRARLEVGRIGESGLTGAAETAERTLKNWGADRFRS